MGMIGNTLAQGLISGANIQDGTVDTPDLKDGVVTSAKIADGAVITQDIADSAVTTAKIATGVVTPGKLSTGAPSWNSNGGLTIAHANAVGSAGTGAAILSISSPYTPASGSYMNSYTAFAPNLATGAYLNGCGIGVGATTNDAGYMAFYNAGTGSTNNRLTWGFWNNDNLMGLSASGNFMVGVTSAYLSSRATVNGNLALTNGSFSSGNSFSLILGDKNAFARSTNGDMLTFGAYNGIRFGRATTNDLTISTSWGFFDSSGNFVLEGGTSGTATKFYVKTSDNASYSTYIGKEGYWTIIGANPNEGWKLKNDNNANVLTVNAGTTNFNASLLGSLTQNASDMRLKTNIQTITGALSKVCSLHGFTFNWNDLAFDLNRLSKDAREVGVFAQDVQQVLPEAVSIAPFDMVDGKQESASGESYLTIQYEKLTPLLIEAIKELKAEFDSYKAAHP